MSELRRNDRVSLDRAIAIRLGNGQLVQARLVNLSSFGLAVFYPAPAEIGITLGLHFQLQDKANQPVVIHCQGVVRHCFVHGQGYITGFEFSQIKDEDQTLIRQFIQRKRANNQR